jgi:peptidoglycan/xylan/chitin deacetylase (PgdA/CDA1 family)
MSSNHRLAVALAALAVLAGCATAPTSTPAPALPLTRATLGRTQHILVARAGPGDTAANLAGALTNDRSLGWRVVALDGQPIRPGSIVAMSLDPADAGLAPTARYVPILCYHNFVEGRSDSKMSVSSAAFDAQLRWLKDNGFTVVPLSAVADYVANGRPLPSKAVAISIDDGYRSAYQIAIPLLRRYGDPATLFVYTDFVGAGAALSWSEIDQLSHDPLIAIQSHSKTHGDMVKRLRGETPAAYAKRVHTEIALPLSTFERRIGGRPGVFAYPFGSADPYVVQQVGDAGYSAAVTVARGGNPAWAPPLLLRRDMIYGGDDISTFARRVTLAEQGASGPSEAER